MDSDVRCIIFAAAVAAVLILAAMFARCRRQRPRGRGSSAGHPGQEPYAAGPIASAVAPPPARRAIERVRADLGLIVAYGEDFLAADSPASTEGDPGSGALAEISPGVAALVKVAGDARACIARSPPTWDHYSRLYDALNGSDAPMAHTARGRAAAGHAAHQQVAAEPGGASAPYYTTAGDALIRLGGQVRALMADVHGLGSALDLE